ncbi:M56 family metallopeptidase [Dactylosporangium vinaceum]|uniref:M56 family metallopeptidase n=1 Tax=Dactylosporangium vinaceum TaxID=53362 RepID=A0ABV5MIW8_9ACTN|nr:M56 family metallopeptidase [Dactylosporangium vinaceum]UAB93777.1 M56 family metallopeptidase [Dactylosporangium vinaceum]
MSPLLLVAFGTALALVAAPRLAAAGWVARSPRLGVVAWLALSAGVLLSALLAGLTLVLYWDCAHDLAAGAWHFCLDALLGRQDRRARAIALAGLAALVLLGARLGLSTARLYTTHRSLRSRLRLLVRAAGTSHAVPGATVVTHPEPAAYLVPGPRLPGRPADIVITSAAVDRLQAEELSAVLAHERGHHEGRHFEATRWMRMLAQAFPGAVCFRLGARQVDRLVEMCADDTAARTAERLDLARALVALAGSPGPAPDLALDGGDALERMHRLLDPPRPLSLLQRAAVATLCAGGVTTPPLLAVLERTFLVL